MAKAAFNDEQKEILHSTANCEEEAGNVCPHGYDVSRADPAGPSRAPAGLEAAGEMLVKCR